MDYESDEANANTQHCDRNVMRPLRTTDTNLNYRADRHGGEYWLFWALVRI